jgi:two-component system response regulator FlrC
MLRTPTILIAEDDERTRTNFSRQLSEIGYIIRDVANARLALLALRNEEFELVIVDLSMPDMDGIELIRTMRLEFPFVPILAVSDFLRGSMLKAAKLLGAAETMNKEAAESLLIPMVCRVLDQSGM